VVYVIEGAEYRDGTLAFLDVVDELDPGEGDGGVPKALEPQHGLLSLFDTAVVLFNHSV